MSKHDSDQESGGQGADARQHIFTDNHTGHLPALHSDHTKHTVAVLLLLYKSMNGYRQEADSKYENQKLCVQH